MLAGPAMWGQGVFVETDGFATKTGFRGVFVWKATQPVIGVVRYGESPAALTQSVSPVPGVADTSQLAVASNLVIGKTYYWQVEDTLTGQRSSIKSFEANNAYNSWNGEVYTINMLVQLDTEGLPPEIPHDQALQDLANGMNIFAERLYDAMDGFARLGKVVVTDTNLDYAINQPAGDPLGGVACDGENTTVADVVVQSTVAFDSHTWSGWAISNPCIGFYVGRIGQLVVPWEDELHFGHVASHELMHYAFNAPDLYTVSGPVTVDCRNTDWDGSLMHNTGGFIGKWELTELDRNPTLTPCNHGTQPYTWDVLRTRYTEVPLNPDGPIQNMFDLEAKGHPDGDGLKLWLLDREPASSTLTHYAPDDTVAPCGGELPQVVDKAGDATRISTGVLIAEPDPGVGSDDNLDITSGYIRWDAAQQALVFHIKVKDLEEMIAPPAITHSYRWYFDWAGKRYQLRANRHIDGTHDRSLRQGTTIISASLPGGFDVVTDEVTIVLQSIPGAPAFAPGEKLEGFELYGRRDFSTVSSLTSDVALGSCAYVINQENFGPNAAPVAVNDSASTTEDVPVDVNVLANDSDPDGDTLFVRSVTAAGGSSASINANGTVRFTPTPNSSGPMSFSYVIGDGHGGTASATVNVAVAGVQDAPAPAADIAHAPSLTPVVIDVLANDSDADGDALTVSAVTQGTFGRVTNNGANVTYSPGGGFATQDSFTYTVSDGKGGTNKATVTVIRQCMTSFSDDLEPAPEAGWTFSNASTGIENLGIAPLSWMVMLDPLASSPTSAWYSDATDVSSNKDDRLISPAVLVTAATKLNFWHRYRTEVTFDGGVLEVTTDNGLTWKDVTAAGGVFVKGDYDGEASAYGGRRAWNGSNASFPTMDEVEVNLGALAGKTIKVRWRLKTDANLGDLGWWVDDVRFRDIATTLCGPAQNRMPDAADDEAVAAAGSAASVAVLANDSDPDGDAIFVTSVTEPANGTTSHDGSSVTYTPDAGFTGTDSFFYSISDGFGGSDVARVTVTVNGAPTAVADNGATNEDQATTINVLANDTDPNGDALTVVSAGSGSHGSTSVNADGSISYVPNANFNGSDTFSYTVRDAHGATASGTVTVTIAPVNDSPVAANDSTTCAKNGERTVAVLANDSDVDGDTLSVQSVGRPASGSVIIRADGSIRYRAKKGFTGTDTFTYTITDGNGAAAGATVTVVVN
ncbi:MAG TPA: Ig-like domain-containing protein [Thermoanaerobaculia bacterium]|nr:Ig-like domain-containing protein [Thermoanaerobaculia bacterium]